MLIYPNDLRVIPQFEAEPWRESYELASKTVRSFGAFLRVNTATTDSGITYTHFALRYNRYGEVAAWNVVGPWTGAVPIRRVAASLLATVDEYAPTRKDYENIARRIRVEATKEGGFPRQGLTCDLFGEPLAVNPLYSRYGFIRVPREYAEKTDENRRKIRETVNASWVAHRAGVSATLTAADSMFEGAYRDTYLSVLRQCMFAYSYQTGVIPPEIADSMQENGLYMF